MYWKRGGGGGVAGPRPPPMVPPIPVPLAPGKCFKLKSSCAEGREEIYASNSGGGGALDGGGIKRGGGAPTVVSRSNTSLGEGGGGGVSRNCTLGTKIWGCRDFPLQTPPPYPPPVHDSPRALLDVPHGHPDVPQHAPVAPQSRFILRFAPAWGATRALCLDVPRGLPPPRDGSVPEGPSNGSFGNRAVPNCVYATRNAKDRARRTNSAQTHVVPGPPVPFHNSAPQWEPQTRTKQESGERKLLRSCRAGQGFF